MAATPESYTAWLYPGDRLRLIIGGTGLTVIALPPKRACACAGTKPPYGSTTETQGMKSMNTATPSRPDWSTRERDACDTLGEALARQGYVIWRPKAGEWAVMDPLHIGEYRTVKSLSQYRPPEEWWSRLWCDCARYETADGACVHKAAVWHEIKKPSPWRMYHEGY